MSKGRLEAFSDGVIAILITIMVLELKVPHGTDWAALSGFLPVLSSYVLSFVFLGIYWSNHHHLFQAVKRVDGRMIPGAPGRAGVAPGPGNREILRSRLETRSGALGHYNPRFETLQPQLWI